MAEYWDIYEKGTDRFVMKFQKGSGVIPAGMYHETVQIFVTDKKGHLLTTRRSFYKKDAGGDYEFISGSVLSGETPIMAAKRELKEETGLVANSLQRFGFTFIESKRHGNFLKRYLYIAHIPDLAEREIVLQAKETSGYKIVTIPELYLMIRDKTFHYRSLECLPDKTLTKLEQIVGIISNDLNVSTQLVPSQIVGRSLREPNCISNPELEEIENHPFTQEQRQANLLQFGTFHPIVTEEFLYKKEDEET